MEVAFFGLMRHTDTLANGETTQNERQHAAAGFYEEIAAAYSLVPDYRGVYDEFCRLFNALLLQNTDFENVAFSGQFARASYLLKEHGATKEQTCMVNTLRVRLRKRAVLNEAELCSACRDDLMSLSVFVRLLYGVSVPASLRCLFPTEKAATFKGKLAADVMRIIVNTWNDEYIFAAEDGGNADEVRVCYAHGNIVYDYDWTYLKAYLHEGARLNLVRPRVIDGTVYPELIIFEPDILIDVSAVARCFSECGTTPLINLLDKLRPVSATPAIVLGNLASQFLDEEVNKSASSNSFSNSIKDFYKANPLNILTSGVADNAESFYEEARHQKANIHDAVCNQLPFVAGKFDPRAVILEPSFFSEMLGLQGRMDFLQLDQRVVIEQKSGRCGYPQPNSDTPVLKTQHYVQVLLYMLILRYNYNEQYQRNSGALQAFLLYSKYKRSLLSMGFAPELVFNAIKVRNGIAWGELDCACNGFGVLDSLTAGHFLKDERRRSYFERFIRPQVESVLSPIRCASALERAYFYRFMRFIAAEHLLSKTGNLTKECSGFASMWHDSLDDKLLAGNIYCNLTLSELPETGSRVEAVTLLFNDISDCDVSNFRVGDIVVLYPYHRGEEPDARRTVVFRCSVEEINAAYIRLRLRAPQSDSNVFKFHNYYRWAVEHDFMESSFGSLYHGMYSFLTAPEERRQLILLEREPQIDASLRLKGDYGQFNDLALRVKQAKDLYLILGPPGTGKTSFGLLNTLREELLEAGTSVLLLSYTNRAVDEICSKLAGAGIDYIRIGSELSCADEYKDHLLSAKAKLCPKLNSFRDMLTAARVYVGTTTAVSSNLSLFTLKQFDLAIIDEASQILEPHLMGLLCVRHGVECAIRKFVMIGDHKQLPAVVQQTRLSSVVKEPELNAIHLDDCRDSLFQRFYKAYGDAPKHAFMLTKQGRMHDEISSFPSAAFYDGLLRVVPTPHQTETLPVQGWGNDGIEDLLSTRRLAFVAVPYPKKHGSDKVNQLEAEVISALVYRIYLRHKETFRPAETVGVIVPYRNQISAIRNVMARKYQVDALQDITIDTVERYQGSQRDYVIYGFTVSRRYQLDFLTSTNFTDDNGKTIDRKLNVAMTRAREHLFLVGNPKLLARNGVYLDLITHIDSRRSLINADPEDFIQGRFTVPAMPVDKR